MSFRNGEASTASASRVTMIMASAWPSSPRTYGTSSRPPTRVRILEVLQKGGVDTTYKGRGGVRDE